MEEDFGDDNKALRRRIWRRWICRLFVVIVFVIGTRVLWTFLSGRAALREAIEATDALDPGWRLEDLMANRAIVPDADNSAMVIVDAYKLIAPETKPTEFDYDIVSTIIETPNHRLNDRQKAALETVTKHFEKALPEYRKVSSMTRGRYRESDRPDADVNIRVAPFANTAARALRYDLINHAEVNNADDCLDCVKAMINVVRSFGDDPLPLAVLSRGSARSNTVSAINHWLAQLEPANEILEQIQKLLEEERSVELLAMYSRGQRAYGFAMLESTTDNDFGLFARMKANHLQFMNQYAEIVTHQTNEQFEQLEKWEQDFNSKKIFGLMCPTLKPTLAIHRSQANLDCSITAVAVERFRQATGKWPTTLNDVVTARLLSKIPTDPFDGKPLRWKQTEDGRMVYSIGKDRVDNNGAFDPKNMSDVGNDIVFRLYDPAHRRLPPLPPKVVEPENP